MESDVGESSFLVPALWVLMYTIMPQVGQLNPSTAKKQILYLVIKESYSVAGEPLTFLEVFNYSEDFKGKKGRGVKC